eukprot:363009-Chlamydomonas_euryale.AAC.9
MAAVANRCQLPPTAANPLLAGGVPQQELVTGSCGCNQRTLRSGAARTDVQASEREGAKPGRGCTVGEGLKKGGGEGVWEGVDLVAACAVI